MNLLHPILPLLVCFASLSCAANSHILSAEELKTSSLETLERKLAGFDKELELLARPKLIGGLGPVGFESRVYDEPEHTEWVQVDWKTPALIDEIVMVPMIWHISKVGFTASGFPAEFRIEAGTASGTNGQIIASFSQKDVSLPRTAPLTIPCSVTASWVRVQTTMLGKRNVDNGYALQLGELLVFSGEENVALKAEVSSSSVGPQEGLRRNRAFVTDGFLPYEMDVESKGGFGIQINELQPGTHPSVTIDLGRAYAINRVHLHALSAGVTVPMILPAVYGLPDHFVIEGANREDFSDAVLLAEHKKKTIYDACQIYKQRFPTDTHRYVRMTALELNKLAHLSHMMSLAEFEVFSGGQNVALNRPVYVANVQPTFRQHEQVLTDGHNAYGKILPVRRWVNELARRHDLERFRPVLLAEINSRYARQKQLLHTLIWLSIVLTASIVIALLIERLIHSSHIKQLRERFAADLHDELGANLHAIHMLSDLAEEATGSEELLDLFRRSRIFAARSADAVRNCTHMLDAGNNRGDLKEAMTQSAARLLRDMQYELTFEGESLMQGLAPQRRMDLFFFFKECLSNIIRHSTATHARIHLACTRRLLTLVIEDNGRGLRGRQPKSLKRRARLLKGRLHLEDLSDGGTRIRLVAGAKIQKRIP